MSNIYAKEISENDNEILRLKSNWNNLDYAIIAVDVHKKETGSYFYCGPVQMAVWPRQEATKHSIK